MISRHEILRTVFREDDQGEVRQFIQGSPDFSIVFRDLQQDASQLPELLFHDFTRSFDLCEGPLLRAAVYQLSAHKWIFSFVMHHIISDGWSVGVLIRELLGVYNDRVEGKESLQPSLRIQYKDYAGWQRSRLNEEHRSYWLDHLSGELPVLELPGRQARPAVKSYAGGKASMVLNPLLSKGLRQLVREQDATLFMGLLAAVNVLLYRYTGLEDIIIGSPVAGRDHIDLEDQIGFYVNTLALRSRFKGTDSFRDLLGLIREETLAAYQHQSYPFEALVEELALPRDMSRHPLFDVFLVLHNETMASDSWKDVSGKLKIEEYKDEVAVSCKFDLQFDFTETGDSITVMLTYNSDLFTTGIISSCLAHLEQLLSSIVSHPASALNQLDYLSVSEREQLLFGFNNTAAPYPADKTIPALFTEQALLSPEKTALVYGDTRLSYSQLHGLSNRMGRYLRERYDIQPGDLVGVQLERSEWQIICLLGILKSGGAYVPVDPAYPQERIDYILSDSSCKLLVDAARLLLIQAELQDYSDSDLPSVNSSRDLMYVIYTSGSTGHPKGCMLEYRGVVNRLYWMWHHYGFGSDEIILQKTSFTFDVSVWELFLPLCFGATEVLCPREDAGSPDGLLSLIHREGITCLHFVPSMLNSFLSYGPDVSLLGSVRQVMSSGEALTAGLVNRWYDQVKIPLHNLYGPTEASIEVSAYSTAAGDEVIPIGRPISNIQLYILGAGDQLSPVGVSGEIWIGGAGLARGYLNQPSLTAERFIPSPFSAGEKLYRTGDLGYWQADGSIVYQGRKDEQVKVRGYRIELGEIAHVLEQHPDVGGAAVICRAGHDGENELIAYTVSNKELAVTTLKDHLTRHLPAYMHPAYYVQLASFPLTPSGKTDRQALPSPEGISLPGAGDYTGARNETEARLTGVWSGILGLSKDKISVKDNFFLLGGHSLKATRLASLLYREFEVKVSLK